jgi:hypothetical protein
LNNVLTTLNLGSNKIGDTGAASLTDALKVNNVLTTLNLGSNKIDDAGAVSLGDALNVNSVLTELYLGSNNISSSGAASLGDALKVNNIITDLELSGNNMDDTATVDNIAASLQRNKDRPAAAAAPATEAVVAKASSAAQPSAQPHAAPTMATDPPSFSATPASSEGGTSTSSSTATTELMQVDREQLAAFVATVRVTEQLRGAVASQQRTLQVLAGLTTECPRTMWLYPKKRSLRNWLSDPTGMLLRDTLMLVVVCPETLCMVPCGPNGLGWEVASPKKWVKKWGAALLCGIQALQLAVLAGRVIGLPFPSLPSAEKPLAIRSSTVSSRSAMALDRHTQNKGSRSMDSYDTHDDDDDKLLSAAMT